MFIAAMTRLDLLRLLAYIPRSFIHVDTPQILITIGSAVNISRHLFSQISHAIYLSFGFLD